MLFGRTFLVWKEGEQWDDCQDSIYPMPDELSGEPYSYAVADGAGTSFLSRRWARILTRKFGQDPNRIFGDWDAWLKEAQTEWRLQVEKIAHSEHANFLVVNGFRAKKPAAATFIGLTFTEDHAGWTWRAAIVGDSCLFKLGKEGDVSSWNIKSSADFSNIVRSVESWPRANPYTPARVGSVPFGSESPIEQSDSIILATDALARWLLKRQELGQPVWGTILALEDSEDFGDLVHQARIEEENPLQNDDVALATLNFGGIHEIFAEQTFVPRPRSTERKPQPAEPVVLRDSWQPPGLQPGPVSVSSDGKEHVEQPPSRIGIKVILLSTGTALVLIGVLLLQSMKRASQIDLLLRENKLLRDSRSTASIEPNDCTLRNVSASDLARQNNAFRDALQNVAIRLEMSASSREEFLPPTKISNPEPGN